MHENEFKMRQDKELEHVAGDWLTSMMMARRLSDERMPSLSSTNSLYDGSPSCAICKQVKTLKALQKICRLLRYPVPHKGFAR